MSVLAAADPNVSTAASAATGALTDNEPAIIGVVAAFLGFAVVVKLVLRPGVSEHELAIYYTELVGRLMPLVDPMLSQLMNAHLRQTQERLGTKDLQRAHLMRGLQRQRPSLGAAGFALLLLALVTLVARAALLRLSISTRMR